MGTVYLIALLIGLGTVVMQLLLSGDGAHAGGDVGHADPGPALEADGDLSAHGHVDLHADAQGGDQLALGSDLAALAVVLSLRFWTFAAMAFGLFGSTMHFLGLASPRSTLIASVVLGLFCGWLASYTFYKLGRRSANTGSEATELLGQVGRVTLAPNREGRAKVRLRVRGQLVDYVATTDDHKLQAGASVMVEEVRGDEVHVSRAPSGLKYEE
jgi:membrane protein implicated in regulation of membrane protease activity